MARKALVTTEQALATAVRTALARAADSPPPSHATRLDLVADALVSKACAGDIQAIKALFERIDGKVGVAPSSDEPRPVRIIHSYRSKI